MYSALVTAVASTDEVLQEEDTESVDDNRVSTFSGWCVAIGMNTTRRPATPGCDRRFETCFLVVLIVGDVFCDVRVGWRSAGSMPAAIDIKARVDTLADGTGGHTRLRFNLLTCGDTPVDSVRHSLTITAAT